MKRQSPVPLLTLMLTEPDIEPEMLHNILHDQSRIRQSNTGLFIDMISSIGILISSFKMRKRVLSVLTILVIISSCVFSGCKKDSSEPIENDTVQQEYIEETTDTGNKKPGDPDDGTEEDDSYIDEEDYDGDLHLLVSKRSLRCRLL